MRCGKFGVAVCKASMLDCRRGSICHRYMCIVLYMKLIWCNGFARDLCSIGGGGLMWHNGFVEIYAQLEEGVNLT